MDKIYIKATPYKELFSLLCKLNGLSYRGNDLPDCEGWPFLGGIEIDRVNKTVDPVNSTCMLGETNTHGACLDCAEIMDHFDRIVVRGDEGFYAELRRKKKEKGREIALKILGLGDGKYPFLENEMVLSFPKLLPKSIDFLFAEFNIKEPLASLRTRISNLLWTYKPDVVIAFGGMAYPLSMSSGFTGNLILVNPTLDPFAYPNDDLAEAMEENEGRRDAKITFCRYRRFADVQVRFTTFFSKNAFYQSKVCEEVFSPEAVLVFSEKEERWLESLSKLCLEKGLWNRWSEVKDVYQRAHGLFLEGGNFAFKGYHFFAREFGVDSELARFTLNKFLREVVFPLRKTQELLERMQKAAAMKGFVLGQDEKGEDVRLNLSNGAVLIADVSQKDMKSLKGKLIRFIEENNLGEVIEIGDVDQLLAVDGKKRFVFIDDYGVLAKRRAGVRDDVMGLIEQASQRDNHFFLFMEEPDAAFLPGALKKKIDVTIAFDLGGSEVYSLNLFGTREAGNLGKDGFVVEDDKGIRKVLYANRG